MLAAVQDPEKAIMETDVSFICVGTPSQNNGSLNYEHLENVCYQVGSALARKNTFHITVIRSTVLPGTLREKVIPILEQASGKKAGEDFGVCNNPEFLREGTAISDFYNPPKTVIGETDAQSGDITQAFYDGLP